MAMQFKQQDNVEGLKRVAKLLLHRDETAIEAIPVLDLAIGRAPNDASLLDLRALSHALAGNGDAAEEDWRRHSNLAPKSGSPDVSRGWIHLRRGRAAEAARLFEAALSQSKRDFWALIGLGVARQETGDATAALGALSKIPKSSHDALSLTHLAEAQLAAGHARSAMNLADVAIDELDSLFARTWLVRAEAKRALGNIDGAERDYNKAWHTADEEGIQERALAGLDSINRPINEDGPE
jgi:tetratricopeptide (TPR) repeat protein